MPATDLFALFTEQTGIWLVAAGGNVPVYVSDIIALVVLTQIDKLHPLASPLSCTLTRETCTTLTGTTKITINIVAGIY